MLGIAVCGFSQSKTWYMDKTIGEIRFTGLKHIEKSEADKIIGYAVNMKFSNELYSDLRSKVFASQLFQTVQVGVEYLSEEDGIIVLDFQVLEYPYLTDVKFDGNKNIKDSTLGEDLELQPKALYRKSFIRRDILSMESEYRKKGYADIEIDHSLDENKDENTAVFIFKINEGKKHRVTSISFKGNNQYSTSTLKRVMESKVKNIIQSGIYLKENIAIDTAKILEFYYNHGYLDAQVNDISIKEFSDDRSTNINLVFYLKEGSEFVWGGMEITGNTKFEDRTLLAKISMIPGKALNAGRFQRDFDALKSVYFDEGYAANQFKLKEKRYGNKLFYTLHITENERVTIEEIIIIGNEKTKDAVILREIPFKAGDIFEQDQILQGYINLYNTRIFSNVEVSTLGGSSPDKLKIVYTVEEEKGLRIKFGAGFNPGAEGFPVSGFIGWEDNNLGGNGQILNIQGNISDTTQSIDFGFEEKWLAGERWNGGIHFSGIHEKHRNQLQDKDVPFGNGVPDPFTGAYVYPDTGLPWPGIPGAAEIESNGLITDYQYSLNSNQEIDPEYLMEYDSYSLSLRGTTGYTFITDLGRLSLNTSLATRFDYIDYDSERYVPYEKRISDNLHKINFTNNWFASFSLDSRDHPLTPGRGLLIRQLVNYTGGILGGVEHSISTSTVIEADFTLFDFPVLENWSYKNIFTIRTSLSLLLPQYAADSDGHWGWTENDRSISSLLQINGSTVGLGMESRIGLEAVWDTKASIRMPVFEKYLWAETFFSAAAGWTDFQDISSMTLSDFQFSFGVGLQSVISMLPVSFYIVKSFEFDENNTINWHSGDILSNILDLKFVISITPGFF